jgi:hypothetical protein
MSFGYYSVQPLPNEKRCPQCGALTTSTAAMCWLCLEKYSIQEGAAKHNEPSSESSVHPRQGVAAGDNAAWVVVGILAVVVGVALATGELADPIDPFTAGWQVLLVLLVPALVVATPALIRTLVAFSRKQGPAAPASGLTFVGIFLSSLGVTAMVGLASFVAFFATCVGLGIGGLALSRSDPIHPGANDRGMVSAIILVSIGAGLVAGLALAIWLFRLLWRRKG